MNDIVKGVQNQVELMPGPNDVLIGHTSICESAHLIANTPSINPSPWAPCNLLRVLELCALIEAVVLHDNLFTLSATLPNDVDSLPLRKRLLEKGILKEYSSPMFLKEIVPALTKWITDNSGSVDKRFRTARARDYIDITPELTHYLTQMVDRSGQDLLKMHSVYDNLIKHVNAGQHNGYLISKYSSENPSPLIEELQAHDFIGKRSILNLIAGDIEDGIRYNESGSYATSLTTLRSFIYWQAADRTRLPWYPDVLRVPLMVTLNQRLKFSLSDQVYGVVSQAFSTTVAELLNEDLPYEAIIPPLGALIFSRCSKREDVIEELLTLRDEFADFRRKFREIEQQRHNAKSIKELQDIRAHTTNLLNAVASKYHEPDQSIFETSLGYAPDVINVLANPLDPSRYKSELLKKSYEWIRDWWCRRPASRLFSVTQKLQSLKLYGQLIPNVFGFEITSDDVSFIQEYNSSMQLLLTSSGSKNPKTS